MNWLWALFFCFTISACTVASDPARAQDQRYRQVCADRPPVQGDTLYYCGSLHTEFLDFIRTHASPQIKRLIVTSYGGQFHSTRDALEIIEANEIKVVAEGLCASACAQYLFIPATKGEVLPGTILVLHTTSTSMRIMRARQDWAEYDRLRQVMDVAAEEEREFYIKYGLDPQLLVEPALAMKLACVSEALDWTDPKAPKMDYLAQWLWWNPREAELVRFGMKPKAGFWIVTLNDAQLTGDSNKKYKIGNAVIGGNPNTRMKVEELSKLPKCESLKK